VRLFVHSLQCEYAGRFAHSEGVTGKVLASRPIHTPERGLITLPRRRANPTPIA